MDEHFAAFSFVDRIVDIEAGRRARGCFLVPVTIREFPPSLVAEAVGQLAAWVSMSKIEFRGRPVAALASETRFHGDVHPGDLLELAVEIEDCDDDAVAYGGWASVAGRRVTELEHCLGPMLPTADFDSPEALRERFALLCGAGATPGRFGGVELAAPVITEHVPGESLRAMLQVPERAPFFGDHFPRRAVFPATLMLDAQMRLAAMLAAEATPGRAGLLALARMTNVKVRSFTTPGQEVELAAQATPHEGGVRVALTARFAGKAVATARVEYAQGGPQ